jgi:hypothetical protein
MADSPADPRGPSPGPGAERDPESASAAGVLDHLASVGVAVEGVALALAVLGLGAVAAGHPLGRGFLSVGLGTGVLGMLLVSGAGFRDSNLLDRDAESARED